MLIHVRAFYEYKKGTDLFHSMNQLLQFYFVGSFFLVFLLGNLGTWKKDCWAPTPRSQPRMAPSPAPDFLGGSDWDLKQSDHQGFRLHPSTLCAACGIRRGFMDTLQ